VNDMKLGISTILVAVILSIVAAYYSVMGLTAVFPAAFWSIVIMGSSLEIGKVMTALWLHKNWKISPVAYKLYLVPALVALMVLTSIGVFGFLSKAHLDQNVPSGDIQAQVSIFDDKIRTQKENIEASRKALIQMDSAVDQTMSRSTDINGASAAVNIRRSQAKERTRLQNEISTAQEVVVKLQEQRAPIAAQARVLEAEIGPIKYVAALIYGDSADQNMLEHAVRWMIILIVSVFDPLAIVLLLAGSKQLEWSKKEDDNIDDLDDDLLHQQIDDLTKKMSSLTDENEQLEISISTLNNDLAETKRVNDMLETSTKKLMEKEESLLTTIDEIKESWAKSSEVLTESNSNLMMRNLELTNKILDLENTKTDTVINPLTPFIKSYTDTLSSIVDNVEPIEPTDHVEEDIQQVLANIEHPVDHPVEAAPAVQKKVHAQETVEARPIGMPDLTPKSDNLPEQVDSDFGTQFPNNPDKGDIFLRVDFKPSKLYRFNGSKWMEKSKSTTDAYAFNQEYIKYLVNMIETGQYDIDDVSDVEKEEIEAYLKNNG